MASHHTGAVAALLFLMSRVAAAAYTMVPRWGHAVAYLPDPPTLVIQGGKTDVDGAYSYSSAPNSDDTIVLPLGAAFASSSPGAELVATQPTGPSYSWHCMLPVNQNQGTWQTVSIGGDGGWQQGAGSDNDSAWTAKVNPKTGAVNYTHEAPGWGSQPSRRIHHGCAAPIGGGTSYISGGLADDGSQSTHTETYSFTPATNQFKALDPLPVGLYHQGSVLLGNGTLLDFGGVHIPQQTAEPTLLPFNTMFTLHATAAQAKWETVNITGTAPSPRRGFSTTLNPDGTVFVFGGANINLSTVYDDGWVFNPADLSWNQVIAPGQGPGPRYDHTAVSVGGGQVVVFGGYGAFSPADAGIHILTVSTTAGAVTPNYTPVPYTSSSTTPGAAGQSESGGSSNGQTGQGTGNAESGTGADGQGSTGNGDGTFPGSGTAGSPGGITSDGIVGPGGLNTLSPSGIHKTSTGAPQSTSSGGTDSAPGQQNSGLTNGRLAGLIVGIGIFVLLAAILLLWLIFRCRRKRRSGRGDERVYNEKDAGLLHDPEMPMSPSQLGPMPMATPRHKAPIAALGVGIAAAATKIHRKVSGNNNPQQQQYTELANTPTTREADEDTGGGIFGIIRRSTRRMGRGIRLVGVTRSIDDEEDGLPPVQPTVKGQRSLLAMLQDEDTRRFSEDIRGGRVSTIPEEDASLWRREGTNYSRDRNDWRLSDALLGADLALPLFPGGPVPTPAESLRGGPLPTPDPSIYEALNAITSSELLNYDASDIAVTGSAQMARNPFSNSVESLGPDDAISSRHLSLTAGYIPTALLSTDSSHSTSSSHSRERITPTIFIDTHPPSPNQRLSILSIPNSAISDGSRSNADMADVNEANIETAHVVSVNQPSATASIISRSGSTVRNQVTFETASESQSPRTRTISNPVMRQVSLLRRISSGIMNRSREGGSSRPPSFIGDLRDPAPQPSDWPLAHSHNSLTSSVGTAAWSKLSDEIYPLGYRHRPSITEVGSIRSVGDMHVIQRELSLTSSNEVHIERLDSPDLIGMESSTNLPAQDDRSRIGIQHPTVILRPTNPGPTPSGSTLASTSGSEQDHDTLLPPLRLHVSGPDSRPSSPSKPLGPRSRMSGDHSRLSTAELKATSSRGSSHGGSDSGHSSGGRSTGSATSIPSPTLPWGAQASPRSSPRGSIIELPGVPRPNLTLETAGLSATPACSSPLSHTHGSSSDNHSSSTSHETSTAQTKIVSGVIASASPASATTATPRKIFAPVPKSAGARISRGGLSTPSPQRSPQRRGVQDMVASLNRRAAASTSTLQFSRSHTGSPISGVRSASGAHSAAASPTSRSMYTMAKRGSLTIANPDDKREDSPEESRGE